MDCSGSGVEQAQLGLQVSMSWWGWFRGRDTQCPLHVTLQVSEALPHSLLAREGF